MSFSPQGFELVWLEDGYGRICCTYCNKHSHKQFVTWFPPPLPIVIASEMEYRHSLWIAKRTLRSSVSRNSHSPRSTLVLQCTDLSPFVYMWDRVGLLTITGLRFGYEFYNKMCSIYIKGLTIKLLILITDALAQWRVWNACVIVSIHRNTLKDGTLLSTWIKGGMDNPLSSLADLVYNTSIALFKVFLTTSHPIVIVSLIKKTESGNG